MRSHDRRPKNTRMVPLRLSGVYRVLNHGGTETEPGLAAIGRLHRASGRLASAFRQAHAFLLTEMD
jgi:hypothetical protein